MNIYHLAFEYLLGFILLIDLKKYMSNKFDDMPYQIQQQKHYSLQDQANFPEAKSTLKNEMVYPQQQVDTYRPSFQSQIRSDIKSTQSQKQQNNSNYHWGNLKPCWFNSNTITPRIVISHSFLRSLMLNLILIVIICILIPMTISQMMAHKKSFHPSYQRALSQLSRQLTGQHYISGEQIISKNSQINLRSYALNIYSAIWSVYQTIFLLILLLSNPGYGDFLVKGQASAQSCNEVISSKKNVLSQKSRCSICKSFVYGQIYHCSACDLCCQGFSHHCDWVGKCIGYRNIVFLKGYFYGYVIGLLTLVLIIILQKIKYQ